MSSFMSTKVWVYLEAFFYASGIAVVSFLFGFVSGLVYG